MPPPGFKPSGGTASGPPGFKPAEGGGAPPGFKRELTQLKTEAPPGYERTEQGLQPAGLIDPSGFTPTVLEEDARRIREGISEAPGKLARGLVNTAERLTDLPITRMYAREALNAGGVDVPGPVGEMLPTQEQAVAAITPATSPTRKASSPLDYLAAFDTEGASPAASDPNQGADVTIPGTGIRPDQIANAAAHNVVGRPVKAFQEGPGTTLAQAAMVVGQPAFKGSPAPQAGGTMGGGGSDNPPTETPLTQPMGGPEARELLAREMLSFYAGGKFQFGFDDKRYRTAVEQLQSEYDFDVNMLGQKVHVPGAAVIQSAAHEFAGLPVYLWTSGAGEIAAESSLAKAQSIVQAAPKMTKVSAASPAVKALQRAATMEGVMEGATQGMLQSAARGEDIFTGAGYGGFLGGVIGWAAGAATAKRSALAMSQDFHTGLMLSRQSTNDFLKELDRLVQAERKGGTPSFEQLAVEGARSPDFDVKVVSGEVQKPVGSYVTVDDQGKLVMRDIEVVATRTTRRQASRPSEDVPVSYKATPPPHGTSLPEGPAQPKFPASKATRTVNPKNASVGEGLQVVVKVRDTPIADAEALERLSTQAGRRMLPVMEDAAVAQTENKMLGKLAQDNVEGGTVHYMAPEQGKVYGGDLAKRRLEKLDETQLMPGADTKPRGIILQASPEGYLEATVISPDRPIEPGTWAMKGGDTVLIDGQAPGTVIGQVDDKLASSRVTVELKNGQKVQVAPAQLTHIPREFYKPPHEGQPMASAKPGTLIDDRTLAIVKGIEQGTTIPEMMRIAGRSDPVWAAAALRDLEAKGVLYEAQPGLFVPTAMNRSRPKVGPEKDSAGYAVFTGTGGPNNRGEIAILRGKDPRNPKNWLIERPDLGKGGQPHPTAGHTFKKTRIESIPEIGRAHV